MLSFEHLRPASRGGAQASGDEMRNCGPCCCARAALRNGLCGGSTGFQPAHLLQASFNLIGPPNIPVASRQWASAARARRQSLQPVSSREGALRAAPIAGFDPLTGRSWAVGRAVPPPTLFRRIHAYSVRSDWPVCSPSAEGGASPNRSTQEEATNGSQISAPEILDLRL